MKKGPFKLKYTDGKKASPAKTTDFNQWSDEAKKQYMDKIRPHARKKYGDRVADKYFGGSNTKKASNYKGRR